MEEGKGIYPGWRIVGASFLTYLVVWGGVWYSFSVFLNTFVRDFSWEKGPASGVFSVCTGVVFLAGPLVGRLLDRYGPRPIMPVGALVLGISLLLCSRIRSLLEFYLYYGIGCGAAMSLLLFTPQASVVSRWFQIHRGTAVGMGLSGVGIGMMILVPLVQWIVDRSGWQAGFLFLAVLVLLIVLPVNLLLVRFPGKEETASERSLPMLAFLRKKRGGALQTVIVNPVWDSTVWTLGRVLRTRRFWFLCLAGMLGNASVIQTTFAHFVLMGTQAGYPAATASRMLGLAGLVGTAGFLFWGRFSDRIGREWAYTLGTGCLLAGFLFLLFTEAPRGIFIFFLFSVFFGFGYGSRAPLAMSICADLFQGPHFSVIYGTYQMALLPGMLAPWAAGMVVDAVGSYFPVVLGMMGSASLACLFVWLAAPRRVRRIRGAGEERRKAGQPYRYEGCSIF